MFQGQDSQGFPVGEIAGIRIQVHWILPVFWLFRLNDYLAWAAHGWDRKVLLLWWIQGIVVLFGSILLHELGHSFAARRVGGFSNEIVLWPLGGLAYCQVPDHWRPKLVVAAAGPAVTLVLAVVGYVGMKLLSGGADAPAAPTTPAAVFAEILPDLCRWNTFMLVFNLVPLFPLDGGRIFLNGAWGFLQWRNTFAARGRAVHATVWAARVAGLAGILYGLQTERMIVVLIFGWGWYTTEQLRR